MTRHLLLFLLLFIVALPITAQQTTDPPTDDIIYIYAEVNLDPPAPIDFEPGQSHLTPTFHEAVGALIQEAGYTPVFLSPEVDGYPDLFTSDYDSDLVFAPTTPTLSLRTITFGDFDTFYMTPFAAFQFPPLPLGTYGWTVIHTPNAEHSLEFVAHIVAGMALYTAYDCEAALPLFDNALDKVYAADESEINGLLLISGLQFYRGNCLYAVGEVDEAIQAYEAGLNDPDVNLDASEIFDPVEYTVHTRTNLAFVYMEQGEMEQALATLEPTRDLIIRPLYGFDDIIGYIVAAEIYRAAGEINLADNEISRLLRAMADSESSSIERLRAQVYTEIGRFRLSYEPPILDEALLDFAFALEADPEYAPAHYWTGVLHMDHGATEAAIESLTTFLANSDDFFDYYQSDLSTEIDDAQTRLAQLTEE